MATYGYDIETTDTRWWKARMTAVAERRGHFALRAVPETIYFNTRREAAQWLSTLTEADVLVAHNLKYDIKGTGIMPHCKLMCTLTLSHLLDENGEHGLKALAPVYLHRELDDPIWVDKSGKDPAVYWVSPVTGKKTLLDDAPEEEVWKYNGEDVAATLDLLPELWKRLSLKQREWYLTWEQDYIRCLALMERKGVRINDNKRLELVATLEADIPGMEEAIYTHVGYQFNLGSPQQLASVLYERTWQQKGRLSVEEVPPSDFVVEKVGRKWVSGYFERKGLSLPKQYSPGKKVTTDKTAMAALAGVPVAEAIQEYREATKLLNTYLLSFPKYMNAGRLHGNFNATGTVTGRASSDHPNLQNIPARGKYAEMVRALFIPAERKCFVIGDLDQIEYRLAAWFSQEPVMIEAFKAGEDIHAATATQVLGRPPVDKRERTVFGKNINFGELFGFGLKKFIAMAAAGGFTLTNARAKEIMKTFTDKMPKVQEWKQDVVQEARVMGYIEMPSGRRRNLPNINHPDPAKRFGAERQAVNTYCQGTAADLLKMITVLMYRKGWVPVLTVHDELVYECAPNKAEEVTEALYNSVDAAADTLGITRRLPNRVDVPVSMNVVTAKDWSEKA